MLPAVLVSAEATDELYLMFAIDMLNYSSTPSLRNVV
jgi:hypothetical protein